jgi:hypothetical protein
MAKARRAVHQSVASVTSRQAECRSSVAEVIEEHRDETAKIIRGKRSNG